jgi:TRAP-type C4-dicarboxylate transport system permease small subunit
MEMLKNFLFNLSRKFNWIACAALLGMIGLVCLNIITRIFRYPVPGTYELVEVLLVICISFALAYGAATHVHIAVDLLLRRIRVEIRTSLRRITTLVSIGLFVLMGWRSVLLADRLWETGEVSLTLWIPHFPLLYGIALNCFLVAVVLAVDEFLE